MNLKTFFILVIFFINSSFCDNQDYYQLLGVPRDATVKEIRKSFKNLAVKLHPDKNKDDQDADVKFISIAKAYEILKDPNTRKHYDLYGEQEFKTYKQKPYHSYTYYRDQFGIYDDDPLIITLSRNDYELNILDKNQAWFVNFYSPNCHHCHELAPDWRKLSKELEGVIRIAAVNCEDDYDLCYQLSIHAYPTLLFYEKESHLYEGEEYSGTRIFEELKKYVLMKINVDILEIANWDKLKVENLLLIICDDNSCVEKENLKKLAATLEGLLNVGIVRNESLAKEICEECELESIIYWDFSTNKPKIIKGSDTKEIVEQVLSILPNPETIDDNKFQEIRKSLRQNSDNPWLLCFYMGTATDLDLQLKRLPTLLPDINIGLVHCGKSAVLCSSVHISRYPSWGLIKSGGAFELHNGRDVLHEVSAFARDSAKSTNLHALSPADFINLRKDGSAWYIDWYAPWCPPCKKLTPELRKASQHFDPNVIQFGTVDCTLHRNLCANEGISSYPSMILYNGTMQQRFHGTPNEAGIIEYIQDMLNPIVINLDDNSFMKLMNKPEDELWIVDFFAPWCGPCQRLGPEWRKLAKSISDFKEVKVAQVDCVANADLCDQQSIKGYPTIRLYALGSKGLSKVAMYNGNRDAVSLKRWILSFLPSNIDTLTADTFRSKVLMKEYVKPWLIDFYAPWCAHCVHFEPEFRSIASKLEEEVKSAKIDCEANRVFCGSLHVTGYPTVRLYFSSEEYYNIDRGHNYNGIIQQIEQLLITYKHKYRHSEL